MDSKQLFTFFIFVFCLGTFNAKKSNLSLWEKCHPSLGCNCTSTCWGNGECNPFLNDADHCYDGGECFWEGLGCEISELKLPEMFCQ